MLITPVLIRAQTVAPPSGPWWTDTFIGTSSDVISTHIADSGGGYTLFNSTGDISLDGAGGLVDPANQVIYVYNGTPPSANYTITWDERSVTASFDAGNYIGGRIVATSGAGNGVYVNVNPGANNARLVQCHNGTFTIIDTIAFIPSPGNTYPFSLQFSGLTAKMTANGNTNGFIAIDPDISLAGQGGYRGAGSGASPTTGIHVKNINTA